MVSIVRISAMQEYPTPPSLMGLPGPPSSLFEIVPDPMTLPAPRGRDFAAWAISWPKSNVIVDAGVRLAKWLVVEEGQQRQVQLAVAPGIAQLVRRDCNRRKSAGGLRLEEAESFCEFAGNQVPQRHVVDEHDELYVPERVLGANAHRHVIRDDGYFGLEVDAPVFVRSKNRLARTDERIRATLVHEGIRPEALGHLGTRAPCAQVRRD